MVYGGTYYTFSGLPLVSGAVKFNRSFQEVRGLSLKENEDNTGTVVANALGVNPDNVSLEWQYGDIRDSTLFTLKGESKIDGIEKPYNFEYHFTAYKPVKQVKKKFVNGLVILTLFFDKPSQPEIEVI